MFYSGSKKELEEKRNMDKVTVYFCRSILKRCPEVVGCWDEEKDSMIFKLPLRPTVAYSTELAWYANATADSTRKALSTSGKQKEALGGLKTKLCSWLGTGMSGGL